MSQENKKKHYICETKTKHQEKRIIGIKKKELVTLKKETANYFLKE